MSQVQVKNHVALNLDLLISSLLKFRLITKEIAMKLIKALLIGICLSVLTVGYVTAQSATPSSDRQDVLYTCNCGAECKCNTVSTQPGKCACGVPLKWGHVIKIEGDEAILCQCEEGCKCELSKDDPSKCACGNQVKRVKLAGTGIHFCNCGGSCVCNTVSDKAGECKCGMKLKKVD